ncbi:MAG: prepilin-type N-terminal cleavage/methylation domain-containing protein [Planctomycetota bacterium]
MRTAGFTLIELIVVLVVIGLLLAFSPLALDFLIAEKELDSEVTRLATLVDLIKTQAVLDQAKYAMHYDTENHRYAIQPPDEVTQETNDPDAEPVTVLVLDEEADLEQLDWHQLPDGITLEFFEGRKQLRGSFAVTFSPTGTVPFHTLVMESNRISSLEEEDRTRTVKVSFTGLVSFARGRVVEEFKLTEAELGR